MNWDLLVSVLILLILGIAMWAKLAHQTIKELLQDIIDLIRENREEEYYYG